MRASMFVSLSTLIAAALIGTGSALAQPIINDKSLPKGMTVAEATKVAATGKKSLEVLAAKRASAIDKAIDAANKSVAPVSTKLQGLAKSDKEFQSFVNTQKTIGASKSADRVAKLKEHYATNKDLLGRVVKAAGGDPVKNGESILLALKKYETSLQRIKDAILAFLGEQAGGGQSAVTHMTFSAPYAIQDETRAVTGSGVTVASATVSGTDASMDLHAYAFPILEATTAEARGAVAAIVDVPANTSSMDVLVRFNYSDRVSAGAAFANGAAAATIVEVFVQDSSGAIAGESRLNFHFFVASEGSGDIPNAGTSSFAYSVPVTPFTRYGVWYSFTAWASTGSAAFADSTFAVTPTAIEVSFR